jgi:hypothetical protein
MPAMLDRRLKCRNVKTLIRPGKNNKLDRVTFPEALTISECVRSTPGRGVVKSLELIGSRPVGLLRTQKFPVF